MFSVTAENSRKARRGDGLVVGRAPHDNVNWITEPGKPEIAVCIPHGAMLVVEVWPSIVRDAWFHSSENPDDNLGDQIVYLDLTQQRIGLNRLAPGVRITVLELPPADLATESNESELVFAGAD